MPRYPGVMRRPSGRTQYERIPNGWRVGSARATAPAAPSFSPLDLSPALWIDPSDAASVTISGSSGAYIGADGLVLPGSGINNAVASHVGAYNVSDMDVRVLVNLSSLASSQTFASKRPGGLRGTFEFFYDQPTNRLILTYQNPGGTVTIDASSNAAPSISTGVDVWVRATRVVNSGGNDLLNFYTSTDGTNWTQVGTQVSVATVTTVYTSTDSLAMGTMAAGSSTRPVVGAIKRAILYSDATGTTKVFDADFAAATPFVSAFTESALGAPVYVVSSTATSSTASYGYVGPTGWVHAGTTNNVLSAPFIAAYSITDDIDIIAKVASPTWSSPGGERQIVNRPNDFWFTLQSTGVLRFTISGAGDYESTVATGIPNGATKWVRVLRIRSTGNIKFYTSDDGSSWTQLGTTVAGTTGAMPNVANGLTLFGRSDLLNTWFGTGMRAQVWSGDSTAGGTKVLDADLVTAADYCTSFTESSSNAATVTITATNTPANAAGACVSQINDKSGNARHLTQGTLANMPKYWNGQNGCNCLVFDGSNDYLRTASGSAVAQPLSLYGIYASTATDGRWLADQAGSAFQVIARNPTTTRPAIYAGAGPRETATALGTGPSMIGWFVDAANTYCRVNGAADAAIASPSTNSLTLATLGARGDNLLPHTGIIGEVFVVGGGAFLSAGNITSSESYLKSKWGTP